MKTTTDPRNAAIFAMFDQLGLANDLVTDALGTNFNKQQNAATANAMTMWMSGANGTQTEATFGMTAG